MKILAVTDGLRGYQSGLWTTILELKKEVEKRGHQFFIFDANEGNYLKLPNHWCPYIPLPSKKKFEKYFREVTPDAVHIFSEAAIGYSARAFCKKHRYPFTTSYTTNFDLAAPSSIRKWIWRYIRKFHSRSKKVHVATTRLKQLLRSKKIMEEIVVNRKGIDFDKFRYVKGANFFEPLPRPYFMTMSRISPEKNIEAFLELDLPGTKFVIGEGHYKKKLMRRWDKQVIFLPYENIAEVLSQGDVFVCPSKFETLGLTMLEAMACGLPVAAYPVMGPQDVIKQGITGFMDEDLRTAALVCMKLRKEDCLQAVKVYSWEDHAKNFLANLVPIPSVSP